MCFISITLSNHNAPRGIRSKCHHTNQIYTLAVASIPRNRKSWHEEKIASGSEDRYTHVFAGTALNHAPNPKPVESMLQHAVIYGYCMSTIIVFLDSVCRHTIYVRKWTPRVIFAQAVCTLLRKYVQTVRAIRIIDYIYGEYLTFMQSLIQFLEIA